MLQRLPLISFVHLFIFGLRPHLTGRHVYFQGGTTGFGFDTAFEDHAATSWLNTQAPIEPSSEITLVWATYDSGDGVLDSTTLVDNFRWIAKPGVDVGTTPIPK